MTSIDPQPPAGPPPAAVAEFTDELLAWFSVIAQIVDHMLRHTDGGGEPTPRVLKRLVESTLAPLAVHGDGALHQASVLVGTATATVLDEIMRVPPPSETRCRRAARGRRRP